MTHRPPAGPLGGGDAPLLPPHPGLLASAVPPAAALAPTRKVLSMLLATKSELGRLAQVEALAGGWDSSGQLGGLGSRHWGQEGHARPMESRRALAGALAQPPLAVSRRHRSPPLLPSFSSLQNTIMGCGPARSRLPACCTECSLVSN